MFSCSVMSFVHGILQARIVECVAMPSSGDLPNPEFKSRFPTFQVDSLLAEPPGKPKNTGVVSLSLLQGIFPTQESYQGLLYCRQILYQLSYHQLHIKSEMLFRLGIHCNVFLFECFLWNLIVDLLKVLIARFWNTKTATWYISIQQCPLQPWRK